MMKSFPIIVDAEFTANMESLLDMVGEGMVEWKSIVRNFYPDLHEAVEAANRELESVKIEDQLSDEFCELCGRQMVIKYGPHGKFLACPGFPDCRNTKPYLEKIGVACPKCGKDLVIRKTKKGRVYYGCKLSIYNDWEGFHHNVVYDLTKLRHIQIFLFLCDVMTVKKKQRAHLLLIISVRVWNFR